MTGRQHYRPHQSRHDAQRTGWFRRPEIGEGRAPLETLANELALSGLDRASVSSACSFNLLK